MASDLRTATRETWQRALDAEERVEVSDVANRVIADYPDLVAAERDRLVWAAIMREIKQLAREEAEAASQLSLFGFPAVIAIPVPGDGYQYMQAGKAHWLDLVAGLEVREANAARAQAKVDTYREALDRARPAMENTDRTLAEAVALLADGTP